MPDVPPGGGGERLRLTGRLVLVVMVMAPPAFGLPWFLWTAKISSFETLIDVLTESWFVSAYFLLWMLVSPRALFAAFKLSLIHI